MQMNNGKLLSILSAPRAPHPFTSKFSFLRCAFFFYCFFFLLGQLVLSVYSAWDDKTQTLHSIGFKEWSWKNSLQTEAVAYNITYHPATMLSWVPSPDSWTLIHTWTHMAPTTMSIFRETGTNSTKLKWKMKWLHDEGVMKWKMPWEA